jgi:hypothetical protein
MSEKPKRGVLLGLAVEGMVPVLGGCAGVIACGPEGGLVGAALGQAVEKVINYFGGRIVDQWAAWFAVQPTEVREKALAELAAMSPSDARKQAEAMLAPAAGSPADKEVALAYLSLLPGAIDRALTRQPDGRRSVPQTISFDAPNLLSLLPVHLPPYPVGQDVPNTPYRLDGLLGSGGFGAVYRASTRTLQHLPLAVKFCLDPNLVQSLHRERGLLERLMKAGGESWSARVVRLYGYDLEHRTPYLVYEYVTGGDLIHYLAHRRTELGRNLNPAEVLEVIRQIAEGLAFAHSHGLVHRDLKPANVLVEGGVMKLADFGLGGVTAARAALVSRIGASTHGMLDPAEQATLFRGAGTPLYMAPEQRRGLPPDPRHDLYSLGVMWFQLLVGDVTRELHPGWARELSVKFNVPKDQIEVIERCVGWVEERPANAGELVALLRGNAPTPVAAAAPAGDMRRSLLVSLVRRLTEAHADVSRLEADPLWWAKWAIAAGLVVLVVVMAEMRTPSWLAFFLASGPAVGVGATLFLLRKHRLTSAQERAADVIHTLKSEFPEQVEAWGGEAVLNNPTTALSLLEQLAPPATAPPAPGLGSLTAAQREELQGALVELSDKHRAAGAQARPFPFAVAAVIALALAVSMGLLFGIGRNTLRRPFWRYGDFNRIEHHDHEGRELTHAEYTAEGRLQFSHSMTLGVVVGVGVGLLALILLTRVSWYRGRMAVAAVFAPLLAVPAGFGAGALYDSLYRPYSDQHEAGLRTYHDYDGRNLNRLEYDVESRRALTTAHLVGWGTGLFVEGLVVLAVLAWHVRSARLARLELDQRIADVAGRFTLALAPVGGVEALRDRGKVDGLIERLA